MSLRWTTRSTRDIFYDRADYHARRQRMRVNDRLAISRFPHCSISNLISNSRYLASFSVPRDDFSARRDALIFTSCDSRAFPDMYAIQRVKRNVIRQNFFESEITETQTISGNVAFHETRSRRSYRFHRRASSSIYLYQFPHRRNIYIYTYARV